MAHAEAAERPGNPDDAVMTAGARQKANRIRGWHHHAIRTADMAATRSFYEGVLDLPLTGTWVETYDVVLQKPSNYMHCFFELGDGSALAFFQFEDGARDDVKTLASDPFEHHVALKVDTIPDVKAFEQRLNDAGYPTVIVDHGYCYSVYTKDPNGMNVEVSAFVPNGEAILAEAAETADGDMARWLAGARQGNNRWRGTTDDVA